jgi:hypothetical protein
MDEFMVAVSPSLAVMRAVGIELGRTGGYRIHVQRVSSGTCQIAPGNTLVHLIIRGWHSDFRPKHHESRAAVVSATIAIRVTDELVDRFAVRLEMVEVVEIRKA